MDHDAAHAASPARGVTEEYGEYVGFMCSLRHGEQLSGGTVPGEPDAPQAPNLTLLTRAKWSEEDFFQVIRTAVTKSGKQLDPKHMPWDHLANMTDDELKALWLFLSSLEDRRFRK